MSKAKISLRQGKTIQDLSNEEILPERSPEEIENKLHLLKHTSEVQSRIKEDISSDFTLARLSDQDKQSIIEMTDNAYYVKSLIEKLKNKKKPTWENGMWGEEGLSKVT